MISFNVNDYVKVNLTEDGIAELQKQRDELRAPSLKDVPLFGKDDEGWTKFQLWDLMNCFGHMMYMGGKIPFETTILIDAGDDVSVPTVVGEKLTEDDY